MEEPKIEESGLEGDQGLEGGPVNPYDGLNFVERYRSYKRGTEMTRVR